MKAINLYNNIAAGTPAKKIKYQSYEFEYDKEVHDYYCSDTCAYAWLFDDLKDLNEEVEIIEEYKEEKEEVKTIEKLEIKTDTNNTDNSYIEGHKDKACFLLDENIIIIDKLNEVIERLNEVINYEEDSTNN